MLSKQRDAIDRIDREIVRLFEERTAVVDEVAEIKWENGMQILDAGREEKVIEKAQDLLQNQALKDEVADLYTELMRISREHQQRWMDARQ